jgi:phosphopantothenoylcysteine decarboxylase/phosphopantothenate--cysteine ligase
MGFAIASALASKGAMVELVTGPVQLSVSDKNIHRTDVNTATEMFDACMHIFPLCKGAILSAAVADYKAEHISPIKIKKDANDEVGLTLNLIKNKDILASLGTIKSEIQLLVGFSLETHNELNFAIEKMERKNCDMIIMNSLKDEGAGFSGDTNKVSVLNKNGDVINLPLKSKIEIASDIVNLIISNYF